MTDPQPPDPGSEGGRVRQADYGVYRAERPSPCWSCGYQADAASEITGRGRPKAGDVAICFRCAALSIYTGLGLTQREPTESELAEVATDERVTKIQTGIRERDPLGWLQ